MLRRNVEKKFLYENLDLVMLTIDEICDDGWEDWILIWFFLEGLFRIILESDPMTVTQRVQLRQDDIPISEQTVSQVSTNLCILSNQNDCFRYSIMLKSKSNGHYWNKYETISHVPAWSLFHSLFLLLLINKISVCVCVWSDRFIQEKYFISLFLFRWRTSLQSQRWNYVDMSVQENGLNSLVSGEYFFYWWNYSQLWIRSIVGFLVFAIISVMSWC
jgi:hypothetical protein